MNKDAQMNSNNPDPRPLESLHCIPEAEWTPAEWAAVAKHEHKLELEWDATH